MKERSIGNDSVSDCFQRGTPCLKNATKPNTYRFYKRRLCYILDTNREFYFTVSSF